MAQAPIPRPPQEAPALTPEEELVALRRKAERRRNEPGLAANVAEIDARIAELEAEIEEAG